MFACAITSLLVLLPAAFLSFSGIIPPDWSLVASKIYEGSTVAFVLSSLCVVFDADVIAAKAQHFRARPSAPRR